MEDRFLVTLDKKIVPELENHKGLIDRAAKHIQEVDDRLVVFKKEVDYDKTEPAALSSEEEEALGIKTYHGIKFDKDGNLMDLTRPQLMRLMLEYNTKVEQIEDGFEGINQSLGSASDQIKSFNKKLAANKSDT